MRKVPFRLDRLLHSDFLMLKPLILVLCGCVMSGCSTIGRRAALPGSYLKPPASQLPESAEYELSQVVLADGTKTLVQFGAAQSEDGRTLPEWRNLPSVVFCYGNRMSLAASQGIFSDLRRMRLNVAMPEYPGYGMSAGTPTEQRCYLAGQAAHDYLAQGKNLNSTAICSIGLSLGASVAAELSLKRRVQGVVLVVPFTSTKDVARDHLNWALRWAAPMLSRDVAFDTRSKVSQIKAPILLVVATRDEVTSEGRSAELSRAAQGPLSEVRVDADHNGAWAAAVPKIESWMLRTVSESLRSGETPAPTGGVAPLRR